MLKERPGEWLLQSTTHQSFKLLPSPAGVIWPMILSAIWGVGVIATSTGLVIGRCRAGFLCRRDCDQPTGRDEKELEGLVKKPAFEDESDLSSAANAEFPSPSAWSTLLLCYRGRVNPGPWSGFARCSFTSCPTSGGVITSPSFLRGSSARYSGSCRFFGSPFPVSAGSRRLRATCRC